MKKSYLLCAILMLAMSASAFDLKKLLNITERQVNEVNIESAISTCDIKSSDSVVATYILYGTSKKDSTKKLAKLIPYNDKITDKETLQSAKAFLKEMAAQHTNITVRSLAYSTLAFAFPDDDVGAWLGTEYFFSNIETCLCI
ncbi:MAG: hypothetical protein RAP03_10100 [Candidatus Electryonea clarkiae]|nr:hypothetical protein [Candidatus Electryonea clarkiae]